jgi:CRP-like cAMP-binding protein
MKMSNKIQQESAIHSKESVTRCDDCVMRSRGILKDVPQEIFESITCCMRTHKFPAKHLIFLEGNPCNQIGSIRKGIIKLTKSAENGKWQNVGMLSPGLLLGYEGFLGRPYQSTAQAVTDVELCMAPHAEIMEQLRQFPNMTMALIGLLCHRIGELEQRALQLGTLSGRQRLAAYLLARCEAEENMDSTNGTIAHQSRQEMAEMLGMAKETLIRLLGKFAELRIININGPNIVIIDPQKLAQMLTAST